MLISIFCKIEDNQILFESVDTSMIIVLHCFKILQFNLNLIIMAFIQNRVYAKRIVPFFFFYSLAQPFFSVRYYIVDSSQFSPCLAVFRWLEIFMFESSQIFFTVFRFVSFLYFQFLFFFVFENSHFRFFILCDILIVQISLTIQLICPKKLQFLFIADFVLVNDSKRINYTLSNYHFSLLYNLTLLLN